MVWLFNLLARLPLPVLHRFGTVLGWLTYWSSGRYAERLRENLRHGLQFSSHVFQFTEISDYFIQFLELFAVESCDDFFGRRVDS